MRNKPCRVAILSAIFLGLGIASSLRADIPDNKDISDGAAKGQASDGIISSTGGYPEGDDGGLTYYYQYFTDSANSLKNSVVLFFYDGDPDRPVFEEFTGYTQTQIDNIASNISITNDNPAGGDPLTISGAAFFTSDTLIPLEDLNYDSFPPSTFTPLPSLDETLAPGTSTPLPAAAWMGLMGMGLIAAGSVRRRRAV